MPKQDYSIYYFILSSLLVLLVEGAKGLFHMSNLVYQILFYGSILGMVITIIIIFYKRRNKVDSVITEPKGIAKLFSVKQTLPKNRAPIIMDVFLSIFAIGSLCYFGLVVYLWHTNMITIKPLNWLGVLIVYLVYPIVIMALIFYVEPKQRRLGKSCVAKERTATFVGTKKNVFIASIEALKTMGFSIPIIEPYASIQAIKPRAIMEVDVIESESTRLKTVLHFKSDSQWTTTLLDIFNIHQRRLDKFEDIVCSILDSKQEHKQHEKLKG
jgi:hypothetical protein